MKNTITEKAINLIQLKANRYNWYAERAASGKATKEDKEVMEEEYNELAAMEQMLTALGFKVEEVTNVIERYEATITYIKVDGKVVFSA